ncbi:MAG: hypothetical protein ACQETH_02070 [Candidatus Rifleibacteriota bacterium]
MSDDSTKKLISCRVCGVIMVKLARDICSKCFQKEEELFQRVKGYLRSNPGSTVAEVAEAMECSQDQVNYFIRTGRLERVGVKVAHPCQICQKTIMDGMICADCKKDLKDQVSSLAKETGQDQDNDNNNNKSDIPGSNKKKDGDGGHVGKRKG